MPSPDGQVEIDGWDEQVNFFAFDDGEHFAGVAGIGDAFGDEFSVATLQGRGEFVRIGSDDPAGQPQLASGLAEAVEQDDPSADAGKKNCDVFFLGHYFLC